MRNKIPKVMGTVESNLMQIADRTNKKGSRQTFCLNLASELSLLLLSEQLQYSCGEETRL